MKQRSQLENESIRNIFRTIVKEEGLMSFWRSYPISYVGDLLPSS